MGIALLMCRRDPESRGTHRTSPDSVFLGRGVPVPTAVILLGAIGGMVSMGMMGLFIGAIVLGIGYKIFQIWLSRGESLKELDMEPAGA